MLNANAIRKTIDFTSLTLESIQNYEEYLAENTQLPTNIDQRQEISHQLQLERLIEKIIPLYNNFVLIFLTYSILKVITYLLSMRSNTLLA